MKFTEILSQAERPILFCKSQNSSADENISFNSIWFLLTLSDTISKWFWWHISRNTVSQLTFVDKTSHSAASNSRRWLGTISLQQRNHDDNYNKKRIIIPNVPKWILTFLHVQGQALSEDLLIAQAHRTKLVSAWAQTGPHREVLNQPAPWEQAHYCRAALKSAIEKQSPATKSSGYQTSCLPLKSRFYSILYFSLTNLNGFVSPVPSYTY